MDSVLAVHTESRGFDFHGLHMSEQFFGSSRSVCSELENSGIRVVVSNWRWHLSYQSGKTCTCACKNTTNTMRTDTWVWVCASMVPFYWATHGSSLQVLNYKFNNYCKSFLNVYCLLTYVLWCVFQILQRVYMLLVGIHVWFSTRCDPVCVHLPSTARHI